MSVSPQPRGPEPDGNRQRSGLSRAFTELSGSITQGVAKLWDGLVANVWRKVFNRWRTEDPEPGEGDPRDWEGRIASALEQAFGDRVPANFKAKSLAALVDTEKGVRLLTQLLGVLGPKGCPCDKMLIASLSILVTRFDDLPVVVGLFDAIDPLETKDDWVALVEFLEVCAKQPGSWQSVALLAARIGEVHGPLELDVLREIANVSTTQDSRQSLLCVVAPFSDRISDDAFLLVLARRVDTAEAAAAAVELTDALAARGVASIPTEEFDHLLEDVRDRLAVRRYRKVLQMLETAGIAIDPFDPFVRTEGAADPQLKWLELALEALPKLVEVVDGEALHALREIAPDVPMLGRYMRAMNSYANSGLRQEEIHELLQDYVGSEEAIRTFHRVGQTLGELFPGGLTRDYVRWALEHVDGPLAANKLKRMIALLVEAGVRDERTQQQLLALFPINDDSGAWLESIVGHLKGLASPLPAAELIVAIQERCPDVAAVHRYLRVHRQLSGYQGMDDLALMDLALDAAQSAATAKQLAGLLKVFGERGNPHTVTATDILREYRRMLALS